MTVKRRVPNLPAAAASRTRLPGPVYLEKLAAPGPGIVEGQQAGMQSAQAVVTCTHVSEILGTRLGLLVSICQSTTRYQVMTRD